MLQCDLCKKTFQKPSTHKRHGFYCRSKKADPLPHIARKRSCQLCIRRKTRCDTKRPSCSICASTGRICIYEENQHFHYSSTANLPSDESEAICTNTSPLRLFDDEKLLGISSIHDWTTEVHLLNEDWELTTTTIKSPSVPVQTSSYEDIQPFRVSPTIPVLDFNNTPLIYPLVNNFRAIPTRNIVKTGSEMSVTFVRQILSSYPGMMLRRETFPPFIHSSNFLHGQMPQSLANCMSIVQMFSTRTPASNGFVWRTIRMEQERLWVEHGSLNKYDLLAAAQAMLIYIIMRMIEGESKNTDFDLPLLVSLSAIFRALEEKIGTQIIGSYDLVFDNAPDRDWQEWAFNEARWRTATIFRIVNMLMDIDGTLCATFPGLVIAPLPGKSMLWESRTAEAWHAEYSYSWNLEKETYGISKHGQLVKIGQKQGSTVFSLAPWEEWCSSMDGFGILVMIAASML